MMPRVPFLVMLTWACLATCVMGFLPSIGAGSWGVARMGARGCALRRKSQLLRAPTLARGGARAHEAHMTAARPPPGRTGFLIELRESIEYLINGDQFIADRVAEFGPVFSTTLFFRPTVVVGGQRNVAEFLNVDADVAESSLPAPLQELMTEKNTLLQTGERHAASRRMIAPCLDAKALASYLPTIDARCAAHVAALAEGDATAERTTAVAKDLTRFSLQLFAELFSGHALTEEQMSQFTTYNGGLFALSTLDPAFLRARNAREALEEDMGRKFAEAKAAALLDTDRFAVFRHIDAAVDEHGRASYDVGYGVTQVCVNLTCMC